MKMRILHILDPLHELDSKWDSSLALVKVMAGRGHVNDVADTPDISAKKNTVYARSARLFFRKPAFFFTGNPRQKPLNSYDLVVIRKEPPFDLNYIYMTILLERANSSVVFSNHPSGLRDTNEKLSILNFPDWIPPTLVSRSWEAILRFQKKIKSDIVIKPLDQKGGKGVFLLKRSYAARRILEKATGHGKNMIMAQKFLLSAQGDKRILLLDGKFLTAYEKHPRAGDFRSNLSLGGTPHPTRITPTEEKMIRDLRPYLRSRQLHFVGLDVMKEKLIEINVTCPAGMVEAEHLYPNSTFAEQWAVFLERLVRKRR